MNSFNFKILTLLINITFTFNKTLRKSLRKKIEEKYLKKEAKLFTSNIEKNNKDSWIIMPLHCIGDLLLTCQRIKSFKEKNGGKVILIVKDINRYDLAKCFPAIDDVIIIPEKIFMYLHYDREFEFSNNPQKGKIHYINPDKLKNKCRQKNVKTLFSYALGLDENCAELEKPLLSESDIKNVNEIHKEMNLSNKTVLISPYAGSLNWKVLSKDFWLKLAEELTLQGYDVVFNTEKKEFANYKTIFLSLSQMGAFATKCAKIITFRSGLTDLMSMYNSEGMITIYPKDMDHPIFGIAQRDVWKNTYIFDENKTDEENMYRLFSLQEIIGKTDAKEIIFNNNEMELMQTILREFQVVAV